VKNPTRRERERYAYSYAVGEWKFINEDLARIATNALCSGDIGGKMNTAHAHQTAGKYNLLTLLIDPLDR